jgi:hypothetical protein
MKMLGFRSSALAAVSVLLLIAPVACGPQQAAQAGGTLSDGIVPGPGVFQDAVPQSKGCSGTGGVKVRPCPVSITKKHTMPEVVVSGPNVTDSAFVETACEKKHICSVGQFISDPLDWYVYPLTKCGTAVIYANGYDPSGGTVGIGNLKVINKDC